ncbi:unnamed protein product [Prunus armeniaca]
MLQREEDEQVVIAIALLDEKNQGHRHDSQVGRGPNVDRHRHSRVMHDIYNYDAYFVQKCDAAGVLGLLPEQKLTIVMRMLEYGSSADQSKLCTLRTTCADPLPGTSNGFYKKPKLEDFHELLVASTACIGNGRIAQLPSKEITGIEKSIKVSSLKPLLALTYGFGMPSSELPDPKMTSTCWVNPRSSTMF